MLSRIFFQFRHLLYPFLMCFGARIDFSSVQSSTVFMLSQCPCFLFLIRCRGFYQCSSLKWDIGYGTENNSKKRESSPFAFKKVSHSGCIRIYIISFVSCLCVYNGIIQQGIHLSYGVRHTNTNTYILYVCIFRMLSIKTSTTRTWLFALVAYYLGFQLLFKSKDNGNGSELCCVFLYLWAYPFSLSLSFIHPTIFFRT